MLLEKYDLPVGQWDETSIPFRCTILEALFPGRKFALVHASTKSEERKAMEVALSSDKIAGATCPELAEGWRLDFASGGRKHGDFFMSDTDGPRVSSFFWQTAEEAVAYGGGLVTDCESVHPIPDLKVLVVEDGEHGTGDCHAKAGPQLWALIGKSEVVTSKAGQAVEVAGPGDERHAIQFRLGVLEGDQGHGHLAKGTAVVQRPGGPDLEYDLIVPLSAFKGYSPRPGSYVWDATLGVVGWSDYRPTKVSYTILQWFSWETIEADVLPHMDEPIERLIEAGTSSEAAVEFFKLDRLEGEYDEDEGLLFNVLRNDVHGRLTHHPYVVDRLTRLLRRKWLHLATGGGLKWTGLMGLPCEELADNEICAPQLPEGQIIATRYPVRSWADMRIWTNVHRVVSAANGKPGLTRHKGVVWMNHDTAMQVGGDFDGDYFLLTPAADYPAMTAEIESWADREPAEIVKVKERLASPLDGPNLAKVAMDNTDNMVGLITYFVAQANAMGRLDLVNELAPELQIAVDKFKYNLSHDMEKLATISNQLLALAWLQDHKTADVYLRRPLEVGVGANDTISRLAHWVNERWQPPTLAKRPLQEFAGLFPRTDAHRSAALQLAARYARLVRRAAQTGDRDAFRPIFRTLADWAGSRPDPDQWAAAVWHAVHRRGAKGSGSLAFNAFPAQVMAAIHQQPQVPDRVAVVGLPYNAYADELEQFDGSPQTVQVVGAELNGRLRSAVFVGDRRLGFVSTETPLQEGLYTLSLVCEGKVVYATS